MKASAKRAPGKQRYLRAVDHVEQECIPFFELEVDFTVVREVLGRDVPPVSSFQLTAEDYTEFLERTGMDMAYIQVPWRLGRRSIVDSLGRRVYQEGLIRWDTDLTEIKAPGTDGVERRIEEMLEALKHTEIGTVYGLEIPDLLVNKAINYEDYFLYLYERPDFIKEFQKRVDDYVARVMDVVLGYPIDAVRLDNMLCMNIGPMISREMMEEFNFPWLDKYSRISRERNRIVCLHTDGNITSVMDRLIELGVQVLHPIEVCPAQDIYEMKERYGGRVAFHGNIDVGGVLVGGSPDAVRQDVEEHIRRLAPGGGYICGSSHNIHEGIPFRNFLSMAETACSARLSRLRVL
ncbi:MAG TPA: uroporphyrinogen decarboxylase family protein [Spirochaetia bacterium]|nr:uroporphyrinogen decarboxylase family protein [Spirochaetia bacterium]